MRLGFYGGTFDPIHIGHLLLAEACRETCCLDEVRFLPAWRNPLKPGPDARPAGESAPTPGKIRAEMIGFAIAGHERFKVDKRELAREAPSYTVDTLRDAAAEFPGAELFFLMGADSWRDFAAWREPAEILKLARIAVANRPGDERLDLEAPLRAIAASGSDAGTLVAGWRERVTAVEMPWIGVAARDLRRRVREGRGIRFQVPRPVELIIEQRGLYK